MFDSPQENASLLEIAKQGKDRKALTRLVYDAGARYEKLIASKIPAAYRSIIDAEDVVQNARLRALTNFAQFKGDTHAEFLAWFRQIALNRLASEVRSLQSRKRGGTSVSKAKLSELPINLDEISDSSTKPREDVERDEAILAVKVNMKVLPTTLRRVVRYYHLDSNSIAETAKRMGKTPSVIRRLLARARQTMKVALGNSSNWFSK